MSRLLLSLLWAALLGLAWAQTGNEPGNAGVGSPAGAADAATNAAPATYLNYNASNPADTGGVARFLRYLPQDIPIEVFIPDPEADEEGDDEAGGDGAEGRGGAAGAVRAAFEAWQEAAEGLIAFTFVPVPGEDTLVVRWERLEGGSAGTFAYRWSVENGLYRFRTTSLTLDPSRDEETLYRFALLQVGHALGLLGRSPFEGDAMSRNPSGEISERDVATLLFLYSLPSGTPAE